MLDIIITKDRKTNDLVTLKRSPNRYRDDFQYHPYHIPEPSPWPLLTSFAVLSRIIGAVAYFNGLANGGLLWSLGILTTLFSFILWFRDIITERTFLGDHTKTVQKGLTIGVILFIVSEAFFFFRVFWRYLHSSLSPAIELGRQWAPIGIETLNPFAIPLLNTILLLSSGATITYAHHALIYGNRNRRLDGTFLTVLLAIIFTALQGVEYQNARFTIADSVFGSCFYFRTGLHGLHVLVGTLFIRVGLYRIYKYHFTPDHHVGYESAILYWHFVDVVWLFLFVLIYWWGSDSGVNH